MSELIVDTFAGPGGWSEGLRALGLSDVGIELDAAACATREAAGHKTIRADVAAFDPSELGEVWGLISSPPCTTFSAAGDQAGNAVVEHLAALIRDLFAGRDTRTGHKTAMAAALTASDWASDMEPAKRAEKIAQAVASAALVAEPARFIAALAPEWITLEQVPAVLPLWQVYAAEIRATGYNVWTGKLNSADYGVPQTRERAILIASRTRRVHRPEPTHYDARKGAQLWGETWVSMADALGWGATIRPSVSVTAGGTSTGGAEPFGHLGREALEAERDARRWVLHTNRDQRPDGTRQTADPTTAPALTSKSGGQWVLRTSFGKPAAGPKATGSGTHGTHEMDPAERPAHAVTTKAKDWSLHRSRGSSCDSDRRDHPADEPAPTITGAGGKPGGNLTWVQERPSTTVQGDPRIGRPGHKDRDKGESQFAQDSVRISVQEAAILQSFPADYPWQGTKTKQFEQVGNAVPPLLAEHVLAMATGISRRADVAA